MTSADMRTMTEQSPDAALGFDLLLVGGGLASGLIALAVRARRPDLRVAIVEQSDRVGGNHTWCLHPQDVPDRARDWVRPLLVHRWSGYDVRFPQVQRTLAGEYAAISSARLDRTVRAAMDGPGAQLVLGRAATEVRRDGVVLDDGRLLRARLVVDARGARRAQWLGRCGYQKFVGIEMSMRTPHRMDRPLLMDATVEQRDGFRFMYVLPLDEYRLLVEDTLFSPRANLAIGALRGSVMEYAARFGCVDTVHRSEHGVLPMPWAHTVTRVPTAPLLAGYRGGWFHPGTGYSIPAAIRVAEHIAEYGTDAAHVSALDAMFRKHRSQTRFAERLNWMLFNCFAEPDMRNALERFYRLPEPLIHRFYAMSMTRMDRARVLLGNPPRGISLRAALGRVPALARLGGVA